MGLSWADLVLAQGWAQVPRSICGTLWASSLGLSWLQFPRHRVRFFRDISSHVLVRATVLFLSLPLSSLFSALGLQPRRNKHHFLRKSLSSPYAGQNFSVISQGAPLCRGVRLGHSAVSAGPRQHDSMGPLVPKLLIISRRTV